MKSIKILLSLLFTLGALPYSVWAQDGSVQQDFSEEMGEFAQDLQNSSEALEQQAEEKISQQDQETMAAMETSVEETNEAFTDSFAQQNSVMFHGDTAQAQNYLENSSAVADGKIGAREHESSGLETAAGDLTSTTEDAIKESAHIEYTREYANKGPGEYILDYEVDQIETLLDQKLDLMEGVMATDITALDVPEDYGYTTETWQAEYNDMRAQANQPAAQEGVDYWHYNSDDDRMSMVQQQAENLTLLYDDVVKKEEKVAAMIETSLAIEETGGIEMILDGLDEEVTAKLVSIDRQILDILTEDAYEKDLAENEDLLVHELTGAPLKGYAKRKALKELGGVYGQVEEMRARNLEGDVLSENEILGLMSQIYDGYSPYAN